MNFRCMQKMVAVSVLLVWSFFCAAGTSVAAPVTAIPGEGAGYLYFPAPVGGGTVSTDLTETVGRIAIFTKSAIPADWLECNGASVTRANYPDLVTYLAGAAAASATLPDMRGEFPRAWDDARGVDPGRVIGSAQASSNLSHGHTGSTSAAGGHAHSGSTSADGNHNHATGYSFAGLSTTGGTQSSPLRTTGSWGTKLAQTTMSTEPAHGHAVGVGAGGGHGHTVTVNAYGGTEARPRNISVIFAIRAK